jgi:twitching motility protein PilT
MTIQQLLQLTIDRNGTDLHLIVGYKPQLKIFGDMNPIAGEHEITSSEMDAMIRTIISPEQFKIFTEQMELDFSFDYEGKVRFRGNIYRQRGNPAVALRLLPSHIPTLEELGLPAILKKLTTLKQGFILVTGPTGHGKSTTLASLINSINQSRTNHIITIEDPIEYVYPAGKSIISQREILSDTKGWDNALRAALREDPDVVLVGEMRDLATIASAITIAETGHLVFATLHTNSAAQAVDRMIDVFPENQQSQIRLQLASTFEAIISQRLVPTITPGRVAVTEVLLANPAARNLIRESKSYMIDNLILTSAEYGMMSLETSLANYVKEGKISSTEALKFALRPELLSKLLR